jgi:hypothetical protein
MRLKLHANAPLPSRTRAYVQQSRASNAALARELGSILSHCGALESPPGCRRSIALPALSISKSSRSPRRIAACRTLRPERPGEAMRHGAPDRHRCRRSTRSHRGCAQLHPTARRYHRAMRRCVNPKLSRSGASTATSAAFSTMPNATPLSASSLPTIASPYCDAAITKHPASFSLKLRYRTRTSAPQGRDRSICVRSSHPRSRPAGNT